MSQLSNWNQKIAAKRKEISFHDFLVEVASWYPMMFYKHSGLVSIYPDTDRIGGIISAEEFEKTRDDLPSLVYDENKDVFFHIGELFHSIQFPHVHHFVATENGNYANYTSNVRNPYLSFHITGDCDNVFYSLSTKIRSRNIYNSVMAWVDCENVYMSSCVVKGFNIFYSKKIKNCANIWFSQGLTGCQECLFCSDLKNQTYCIKNQQYTKEEYEIKKTEILDQKEKFIERHQPILDNKNTSTMLGGSDIEHALYSFNVHNAKNIVFSGHDEGLTDVMDTFVVSGGSNCFGGCSLGGDSEYIYCSVGLRRSFNMYYSYFCEMCTYCFGCVGLKNKSFCIFNKQYTKEDWHAKVEEIFMHMERNGILGNFLPSSINPFYVNDTAAFITTSINEKDIVNNEGLRRSGDISVDIPENLNIVDVNDIHTYEHILNGNWIIDEKILTKVIKDSTGQVYRILPTELKFLGDHGLPLPREHRLKRIKKHFS